jgi:hypothetical protein
VIEFCAYATAFAGRPVFGPSFLVFERSFDGVFSLRFTTVIHYGHDSRSEARFLFLDMMA